MRAAPEYTPPPKVALHRSRFWSLAPDHAPDPSSCWGWTGRVIEQAPVFYANGLTHYAYRFSFELELGPVNGLSVRRDCRTHACVRPTHLVAAPTVGTPPRLSQKQRNDALWLMRDNQFTPEQVAAMFGIHVRYAYALRAADPGGHIP